MSFSTHVRATLGQASPFFLLLGLTACSSDLPTSVPVSLAEGGALAAADRDPEKRTPPGWDKRVGKDGDRYRPWKDDGEHPSGQVPPGRLDLRYVVAELDEDADLSELLVAVDGKLMAEMPEIGMVRIRSQVRRDPWEFLELVREADGVRQAEFEQGIEASESCGMTVSFNDGFLCRSDVEAQPFLERLGVYRAQAVARGAGVRVAVLDTGTDPNHGDLASRTQAGWDQVGADDSPWDIPTGVDEDGDGLIDEAYGHGTHVAGIISLLAPDAEILVYRVLNDEGWGSASGVAQAVIRAVQDGADVINLSLGMYDEFKALDKAVELAVKSGVVVVAAVGNDGAETPAQYPALYSSVLTVGSADPNDAITSFSSFGAHLDVTAPGVDVYSLYPGGGYACWSGSSMSTSIVSALCALVIERNPTFSPIQVQRKVIGGVAPGTGIPGITGYGRVDFLNTLR